MLKHRMKIIWFFLVATMGLFLGYMPSAEVSAALQSTFVPTVTGTPHGPMILVPEQVNVRTGPSVDYEQIGVLISGQEAVALGRSPGGDWIQIVYFGVPGNTAWVYAPYVNLITGQELLPVVEPPPTPTPRVTSTIDPTLAAQFNFADIQPTRLPTFTPAGQVMYVTYTPVDMETRVAIPPIFPILGLLVVGFFGVIASIIRR